ncbi:MAG: hypothetical protein ACRELX_00800 [Longimicrobiales bacterium]
MRRTFILDPVPRVRAIPAAGHMAPSLEIRLQAERRPNQPMATTVTPDVDLLRRHHRTTYISCTCLKIVSAAPAR